MAELQLYLDSSTSGLETNSFSFTRSTDYDRALELGPVTFKMCVNIGVPRRALGLREGFEVVRRAGEPGSSPSGEEGKHGREPELAGREEGRGKQPLP